MSFNQAFKPAIIATAITAALSFTAVADDKADDIEHLSIFGHTNSVNDIPGSAHHLNQEALDRFDYTDIMRTLTAVPGVYVLEEDGYGLRPNVGMRGTGQNRSEKVTIMEDGVLAAPAPYAAPSAYYFPTSGRMESVEVLKGTSSAMFGPRTTGGVINMLSRQIPTEDIAGRLALQAGEDGFAKVHGYVGGSGEQMSSVVEVFHYQADGFKDVNHSNADTGFKKNDILAKVKVNSDKSAQYYQELEFKVKYADESSDETYMGLTQADFDANPYSRYSASQLDNMSTEHKQFQVNHSIDISKRFTLGTTAYYNDFKRNWYKTSKVNGMSLSSGGIDAAADFDADPTIGDLDVQVKANNRAYLAKGVQSTLFADLNDHQVKVGVRYHEDEMDRFQWVDDYVIDQNYDMTQTEAGVPGTDSNRIDSASALAIFVHDEYTINDFVINAGLRYEDMTIERNDWGKSDPGRTATPSHKKNDTDVWLPSLALTYKLNQDVVLLGGIQKGFAPPAPGNESAESEKSVNYELGLRFNQDNISAEAIAFYSDYSNMHGNCTASQGCDDDNIGNQYNAGEVDVKGFELKAGYVADLGKMAMPVDLTYTYTSTEFKNDFSSDLDTWGDVVAGDEMPYVPENQLQLTVGLEGDNWRSDLLVRYMGKMRVEAGQGSYTEEDIDSRTVVDFAAHYAFAKNQQVTFNIDNLLDEEYVTSKTHGSIMVGKPRTMTVGYRYEF
ncbi:TonB-dependent receptor [Thalassotalea sp. LPB0316]|uniref:TonB-dependent receptor family protein n=1 Tax=Thalassotalea sp. LPB0316 TaxID=2769490 RepID=UPI001865BA9D|nr:TonB-dependent receptor [Thalassotalea sp. LPB0316]QOL26136.1 TonB-dependent receptor [Thalassotalea sp. LPB0316]